MIRKNGFHYWKDGKHLCQLERIYAQYAIYFRLDEDCSFWSSIHFSVVLITPQTLIVMQNWFIFPNYLLLIIFFKIMIKKKLNPSTPKISLVILLTNFHIIPYDVSLENSVLDQLKIDIFPYCYRLSCWYCIILEGEIMSCTRLFSSKVFKQKYLTWLLILRAKPLPNVRLQIDEPEIRNVLFNYENSLSPEMNNWNIEILTQLS